MDVSTSKPISCFIHPDTYHFSGIGGRHYEFSAIVHEIAANYNRSGKCRQIVAPAVENEGGPRMFDCRDQSVSEKAVCKTEGSNHRSCVISNPIAFRAELLKTRYRL